MLLELYAIANSLGEMDPMWAQEGGGKGLSTMTEMFRKQGCLKMPA